MTPKFFDIHSHLNFSDFNQDRENIIKKMQEENIWSVVVGTDRESSKVAVELTEKYENIFASVGLHPTDSDENFDFDFYKNLAAHEKVVAIGECGIDMFRQPKEDIERQKKLFEAHIKLALELDKPLMIHCRDGHREVLEILDQYSSENLHGNIHFFSGSQEDAQKYFDLGFTISFAGVITFARDYDEIIKNAPLEKIMAETDAPFVAPVPHRGKRNEPKYVEEIVKKIAEIREESYDEVAQAMVQNALRFFRIG